MADKKSTFRIGCGSSTMFVLMFIVMFTLKLAEVGAMKDLSWWWVTAPLWGVPASIIGAGLFVLFGMVILAVFSKK